MDAGWGVGSWTLRCDGSVEPAPEARSDSASTRARAWRPLSIVHAVSILRAPSDLSDIPRESRFRSSYSRRVVGERAEENRSFFFSIHERLGPAASTFLREEFWACFAAATGPATRQSGSARGDPAPYRILPFGTEFLVLNVVLGEPPPRGYPLRRGEKTMLTLVDVTAGRGRADNFDLVYGGSEPAFSPLMPPDTFEKAIVGTRKIFPP